MSDSQYEREVAEGNTSSGFFDDSTLRLVGIVVSGAFALVVVGILALILDFADPELFVDSLPRFGRAFVRVLGIVVASSALSIPLGILVGLGRSSRTSFTNRVATGYVEFFRGTPLLFQLLVIYYGIPALYIEYAGPPFPVDGWKYVTAVVALMLNHGAYVGEAIRGGIAAVPDGQIEAARSLGMSYVQSMREVVLPQAWRNALAAVGNDQIILVKDTSLLTVIALPELIHVYRNINSNQFDPWTPVITVAIAYLLVTVPLGRLVRYLEHRGEWRGDAR